MARRDRLLMQQAYGEIKRRIVMLELQPGQRIDDYELSLELEVSRTPVREAIFRLGAEGLIDIHSNAGFIVRPLDLLDIANLFEAHVVLAQSVARLAANRVTNEELEAMSAAVADIENAIERGDYLAITRANALLGRLEAAATKNRHLQAMANSVHDQSQRLAYLCFVGAGETSAASTSASRMCASNYRRMIEALSAGDPEAAERIAVAQVDLFRKRVQTYLESEAIKGFGVSDEDFAAVALSPAS